MFGSTEYLSDLSVMEEQTATIYYPSWKHEVRFYSLHARWEAFPACACNRSDRRWRRTCVSHPSVGGRPRPCSSRSARLNSVCRSCYLRSRQMVSMQFRRRIMKPLYKWRFMKSGHMLVRTFSRDTRIWWLSKLKRISRFTDKSQIRQLIYDIFLHREMWKNISTVLFDICDWMCFRRRWWVGPKKEEGTGYFWDFCVSYAQSA